MVLLMLFAVAVSVVLLPTLGVWAHVMGGSPDVRRS